MTILLTKDNYEFLIYFFTSNGFKFDLDYQYINSLIKELKEYFSKEERRTICFLEVDSANNTLFVYSKYFDGEFINDMVDFLRKG